MSSLEDDVKLYAAQEAFESLAARIGRTLDLPSCDVLSAMIFGTASFAAQVTKPDSREALLRELPEILTNALGHAFDDAGEADDVAALADLAPLGRA